MTDLSQQYIDDVAQAAGVDPEQAARVLVAARQLGARPAPSPVAPRPAQGFDAAQIALYVVSIISQSASREPACGKVTR